MCAVPMLALLGAQIYPAARQLDKESCLAVVYLEVPAGVTKDVGLELHKIILVGKKDSSLMQFGPRAANAKECAGKQHLLCEQPIAPGRYDSIRVCFSPISDTQTKSVPSASAQEIAIPFGIDAAANAAVPIFLHWDPRQDIGEGEDYQPWMQAIGEEKITAASLAFVANANSNYLTCLDRFRQRVVDVIRVGLKPAYLAFSASRQEVYVANSGSDDISVINVQSCRTEKNVRLRGGDSPARLALTDDQNRLYVLNTGSNSISIIDLPSYQEERRIHLETSPSSLVVDGQNNVAYVAGRNSDRLFAIDPSSYSVVTTQRFGANLDELAFQRSSRKLFAVKPDQRQLTVLDVSKNLIEGSLKLCGPASSLAIQSLSGTLFAAIPDCRVITILKPVDNLEIGAINLPFAPGKILLDPESKFLLVSFPTADEIGFYNANSWESHGTVEVGKAPFAMVIAQ